MQTYRLTRKHKIEQTNRQQAKCKSLRWICNEIVVLATSEQRARELASRPMPTFGLPVSRENTIDIPYAWSYDVEPWIWADPSRTECKVVGPELKADKEMVSYRAFNQIGAGRYKKIGIGKRNFVPWQ